MAAQGPESNARLMLNVLDLMLDLMLSNVSYPPQAAQEVIHDAPYFRMDGVITCM